MVVNSRGMLINLVGYGISADFRILSRSWTFLADILSRPKRVLDLQMLASMVSLCLQQSESITIKILLLLS